MNASTVLLDLINGYKTYSAAILTIVTGIGAILSKNYSQGIADIMQALTLIFGGTAVVGLRHAVAKVPRGFSRRPGATTENRRHSDRGGRNQQSRVRGRSPYCWTGQSKSTLER